MHDH
ncbi:hypothetical protein SAMN06309944_0691 [Micrococcales bacterium KH10]